MGPGLCHFRGAWHAPVEKEEELGFGLSVVRARNPQMSASPISASLLATALALAAPCLPAAMPGAESPVAAVQASVEPGEALHPDPLVRYGELANGLRFAIRPQTMPPARVSLCLYINAGSRYEGEAEHGYAHFVEHMAFAGTRDFPGDSAIRTLQRYGLAFGSEVNAATGRSYTRYEIRNLPAGDPEALATALKVLRNFADGVRFEPDAVEHERGVILSEASVRAGRIAYWWGRELEFLSPDLKEVSDNELAGVFPNTALARSQLGEPRAIRRATLEGLRAFYQRWYRPERMVLAVAGDVDSRRLAAQVTDAFSSLAPRDAAVPPEIAVPAPRGTERIRPTVFAETESTVEIVTLAAAVPRRTGDIDVRRREELAEAVAMEMLERRLARSLKVAAEIETLLCHEVPGWTIPVLRLRTSPRNWPVAAVTLETEVRRAVQHGFGVEELAVAAEARRRKQLWAERDAGNRTATEVAVALAHATGAGLVFQSASEERRWTESVLATLTPQDCRAAVERLWPAEATQLVMTGPAHQDADEMGDVRKAMKAARTAALAPYVSEAEPVALLPADFGPPGVVVGREYNAALDCWLVQFDNGVQLNFKATNFEQGRVRVRVGFGYGLLGTEPGREGLVFGIAALCYGDLANLNREQERELMARGEIATSFSFGADRLGMSATCAPSGVDATMRLLTARLAAPGNGADAEARARAFIDEQLTRYDRTSAGVAEDRLREHLFGGHHALTRPRRAESEKLTFAELRQWIEPQLLTSPLEITVVGDIGLDAVTTAVMRTFGALPLRSTVDQMADRRLFTPGRTPQRIEARFQGKNSVGSVALAWRLYDVVGQDDDCRLRLLASVLEDRIRVRLRQEMGKTYTPVVGLMAERALAPALLFLRCRIETAPKQIERVSAAAKAVVAELVRSGITAEELERARLPLVRQAEDNATSNTWWLSVLSEAQSKPQYVEGQGTQKAILNAITREELDELARLLFAPDRLCEVLAVPE